MPPVWTHTSADSAALLAGCAARSANRSAGELAVATARTWGLLLRGTPPLTLVADTARWWATQLDRKPPEWSSAHDVTFRTPIAVLRDFSVAAGADDVVPTLVLPPQAGHASCIVDYNPAQSQLGAIRGAGLSRVYSVDWVSATAATANTTVEDYIDLLDRAVEAVGGRVNLIGDCQGGWLAAIYAALRPERVHTLTLGGAPIDFHAGDGIIPANVQLGTAAFGMEPYRLLVAASGGVMRGGGVLQGFIGIRPEAELGKRLGLFFELDNPEALERYRQFEDWFMYTQDLPGAFYLWLVEHLFWRNELIRGELRVGGERVDLGAIRCPLYLLAGADDHITPPAQAFAIAGAVGTPASDIATYTSSGGHLGLFMGREALRELWPELLADVYARSIPSG